MTRRAITPGSAALLALVLAPLSGCTTGRQFSIAMTNPGTIATTQTVLVLGDGDPISVLTAPPVGTTPSAPGGGLAALIGATGPVAILSAQALGGLAATRPNPAALGAGPPPVAALAPAGIVGSGDLAVTIGLQPTGPAALQVAVATPVVATSITAGSGLTTLAAAAGSGVQAVLSIPVVTGAATLAAGSTGVGVQTSTPIASATLAAGSGVQAALSTPIVMGAATLAAGQSGLALQASTPVASTILAAAPTQGLQVAVTSPAVAPVVGTVVAGAATLQATLAEVTSAVTLSAPTPGASTPSGSLLKTLTGTPTKKLKHG